MGIKEIHVLEGISFTLVTASIRLDDHYSKDTFPIDDFKVFKIKASGKITFGLRQ